MKKILLFGLFLFLYSCAKTSDNTPETLIAGTWTGVAGKNFVTYTDYTGKTVTTQFKLNNYIFDASGNITKIGFGPHSAQQTAYSGTHTISNQNGVKYLNVNDGYGDFFTYQISVLTAHSLVLNDIIHAYTYTAGNNSYTATNAQFSESYTK